MKCPKCQGENLEGKKYCTECGAKLEALCPDCHSANPPQSKFCGDCGRNLSPAESVHKELSFDEKIAKIQKYLPKGITEKILSQRDKIEGERKQVTVMFCDMKGYTPLAEKLSPEEVYEIMDKVYEILIQKVQDYDGTVNEMTGDGIMALFGAPIALEDAPQRAIRSAMAVHREMTRFNEKLKQKRPDIQPLKMRAGIHTGPVVVGTLGNDLRVEFKAVGDTVNLAARMEQIAEPGTTYVSDDTFKLTEGFFRFEALGEREIKGKEKPIRVYQVIAPSTRRTRFDVSAERGLTPLVGRQRELELLLEAYERAKEGRGQAVSIISDAGIGKSRLLYEFRKAVTNEYVTFLEGKCLSYSRNVAYHPVVDALKANFEVHDSDTDQEVREKVVAGLKILGVDEGSTLPYLLDLLSVKDSGIENISMSPEARKDRTLEALKRIVLKGSEIRPVIMAIEDLHWMDRSSEDAFKRILESIAASRVLFIFTYRPEEFTQPWPHRSYHSQIKLNRLSIPESLTMTTHILGTPHIKKDLENLILQNTEGIPFFLEEFIKSLKDLKAIEDKEQQYQFSKDFHRLTIPSTIQDMIMARVDNLPEEAKEVLRAGAAIEREFSYDLIKRVTGLPEQELLSHLSTLNNSELLYERGIHPDSTYVFKHALTREVVYDSILTKKRKQIHEKIAGTIEDIYKSDICYHYGVLANHYIASERYERGADYARLEAKRYQKSALYKDAIDYAKKWIGSLEKLPQTDENQKQIIDARVVLATYYLNLNYHVEAWQAVEPVIDLAVGLDYQKGLSGIYTALGLFNIYIEEDFSKGGAFLGQVFDISEKARNYLAMWFSQYQLGCCLLVIYQFKESMGCLKTSLVMSQISKNLTGIAHSKSGMALNYNFQNKPELALSLSEEALDAATESKDAMALQPAYSVMGLSFYYKGYLQEAEKNLLEGLVYFEKASIFSWGSLANTYLGYTYGDTGEYEKAKEYLETSISIFEDLKVYPSWLNVFKLFLVKTKILNHESDIELDTLNNLVVSHENNKLALSESQGTRCIGEIYLNLDDQHMAESESWIKRAIEFNTKHNTHWELARDYSLYADWYKKKGDNVAAKEQLTRAIELFRECGADGWVTMTEEKLAKLM
jgi:class 3 adenylate cyclase/tetratricopeptide (TPR) repeat protein